MPRHPLYLERLRQARADLLGIKTAAEVQLTFTIAVVFFALAMIPAGRLQNRYGPRVIGMIGAGLLGVAFLLTALFTKDLGVPYVYLTYGVLGGIGMGFGYVTPIAACAKWFPDKRGLVTGLAVAGSASQASSSDGWRPRSSRLTGSSKRSPSWASSCWSPASSGRHLEESAGWLQAGWVDPASSHDRCRGGRARRVQLA